MIRKFETTLSHATVALLASASIFALAPSAFAQATTDNATVGQAPAATPSKADEATVVVVTGTSIRGIKPVGAAVESITTNDIKATGATNVTQVLQSVPEIANFNSTGISTSAGQASFVDQPAIHGVGVGNGGGGLTLVLVNGNRLPGAGINQTAPDPSAIPASALQRVEVIADGASSVYGSDAIAGVINFITRSNFNGTELNVRKGWGNGFQTTDYSLLVGHKWTGGSVTLDYEASGNTDLNGSERSWFGMDQRAHGTDYRATTCAPAVVASGASNYVLSNGTYAAATKLPVCDLNKYNDLFPAQKRQQGLFSLTQQLGDRVTFTTTDIYSERQVDSANSITTGSANLVTTTVSSGPYYNNAVALGAPAGTQTITYNPSADFGPTLTNKLRTQTLSATAGFDIRINDTWHANISGNYGREHDNINLASLNTGLLTSLISSGAFNPYDVGASNSPSLISQVEDYRTQYVGIQTVKELTAKVDGTLFQLPGGPVKAAFGVDHRDETFDATAYIGASSALAVTKSNGKRSSNSAFAEVDAPLVGAGNARPGVESLDLSLSARYDDYSDVGHTVNPKLGINYKPVDSLLLRASIGSSFHAPSLADAGTAIDTRAIRFVDFTGSTTPGAYSIILAGGNKLKPEKANTLSTGFDFRPSSVPGLHLSSSFFHIKYENVITFPTFAPVSEPNNPIYDKYRIYNPTLAQTQTALAGFRHDGLVYPDVSLLPTAIYDLRRQNFATQTIEGFDFDASANLWKVNVGVGGTYLTKFDQVITGDTVKTSRLNTAYAVKLKGRAHASYAFGDNTATVFVNYTGSYRNTVDNSHIPSFTTLDLHLAHEFDGDGIAKGVSLALDVQNLTDQKPPYYYDASNSDYGADMTNSSPLGRVVSVDLFKKW